MLSILSRRIGRLDSFLRTSSCPRCFISSGSCIMQEASDRKDHLTSTASNTRESDFHNVHVTRILDISPTVKQLTLRDAYSPTRISFKAGQWVDLFITGLDTVGGFSITSSPSHLKETGELHLAVKCSEHPPAKWVHEQCQEAMKLRIRVGGDFFLDPDTLAKKAKGCRCKILFVGGGVGINPLASMILELRDTNFQLNGTKVPTALLFSAKTKEEIIFRETFDAIGSLTFHSRYFVTGSTSKPSEGSDSATEYRRITTNDIEETIKVLDASPDQIIAYVCGPPNMIEFCQSTLQGLGVSRDNINYESWW